MERSALDCTLTFGSSNNDRYPEADVTVIVIEPGVIQMHINSRILCYSNLPIESELLKILQCPITKSKLRLDSVGDFWYQNVANMATGFVPETFLICGHQVPLN